MRDISLRDARSTQVNEVLSVIQETSPKYVVDVDLIDYYEDERQNKNEKSLTFRIVFRADDRTLESKEIDGEVEKILKVLKGKLGLEVR